MATAAQLRFDLRNSPSIPEAVKARALRLAGSRATNDGVLVIAGSRYRSQQQNRDDVVARLVALLRKAATPPKRRIPTRPTLGARTRRLDAKGQRSGLKRLRSDKPPLD